MQSLRPIDLAPIAEQISPVNGAINHAITIAAATLLPGEKQADYEGVAAGIVKAAQPKDMIEEFLVRDIVDLTWEILRLRRIKAGILRASIRAGVYQVLANVGYSYPQAGALSEKFAAGDESARQKVDSILAKAGLAIGEATAKTLESKLDSFERLDQMLASAEARRNNALREIEDAEFRDVETGKAAAGAAC